MKKLKSSLLSVCTLALLTSACSKLENPLAKDKKKNKVVSANHVDTELRDIRVVSEDMLKQTSILPVTSKIAQRLLQELPNNNEVIEVASTENVELDQEKSLIVGIPMGLIGHQQLFGGVFTKVSDTNSEALGSLKLTDLPPIHVRTIVSQDQNGSPVLALVGCVNECTERSQQVGLVSFPVVGVDQEKKLLMLDLATMGNELDLVKIMDPNGEYTKLKTISSETVLVDYEDISTLIFDIKTRTIPVTAKETDQDVKVTELTTRWYLKLSSVFSSSFETRAPVKGVGFFETARSKTPKITRFDTTHDYSNIRYYIKDVPEQYRPHFSKAFENWNKTFKKTVGRELLEYKFIEKTDPLYSELVPGDVRYNIIEWDLVNRASYGGLGPSIANQFTGEILSANILIQGPTIERLYKRWFVVSKKARELKREGLLAQASELMKSFNLEASQMKEAREKVKFAVKLGKHLTMNVRSQQEELEDPTYKGDFDLVPEGMTYDQYMEGYFTEMVEHEMGHNLGLRHNFKGNLGAADEVEEEGFVSRSVMEYLGRPFRYKNSIGLYDEMAISYGYQGLTPTHTDWFCTDDDQALDEKTILTASPECSKSDATADPFSYWERRLSRALEMLMNRGSGSAPVWTVQELDAQIKDIVMAFANYGLAAENTADTWTNFFGKGNRPERKEDVKDYVIGRLKRKLCDSRLLDSINSKESEEAKAAAQKNYDELMKTIVEKNAALKAYTAEELKCN